MSSRNWKALVAVGIALAVIAAAVVYWATARPRTIAPPARAVQSVLELRRAASVDTTAYARYFEDTAVAEVLAEDARSRKDKSSPVPKWKAPEVTSSSDTSATVVVEWERSGKFASWPPSTTFSLAKKSGRWVIVDAVENRPDKQKKPNEK